MKTIEKNARGADVVEHDGLRFYRHGRGPHTVYGLEDGNPGSLVHAAPLVVERIYKAHPKRCWRVKLRGHQLRDENATVDTPAHLHFLRFPTAAAAIEHGIPLLTDTERAVARLAPKET